MVVSFGDHLHHVEVNGICQTENVIELVPTITIFFGLTFQVDLSGVLVATKSK